MTAIEYNEQQRIRQSLKQASKKRIAEKRIAEKQKAAKQAVKTAVTAEQIIENQVLEWLNASHTIGDLLSAAVLLVNQAVEKLLAQVFRKDDYAVKYAVEPLLNHQGPLGELTVRLKLLYGLGVLQRADYEDCALLLSLRDELLRSNNIDDRVIGALAGLHCFSPLPPLPAALLTLQDDPTLNAMRQQRYQQIIHSSTVLSLSGLISRISAIQVFGCQEADYTDD